MSVAGTELAAGQSQQQWPGAPPRAAEHSLERASAGPTRWGPAVATQRRPSAEAAVGELCGVRSKRIRSELCGARRVWSKCACINFLKPSATWVHLSVNRRIYCHVYSSVNRWTYKLYIPRFTLHSSVYERRNISLLYSGVPRNLKTWRKIHCFPIVQPQYQLTWAI
jgi:hypothetical protein